jgi:hypothetical protein
VTVSRALPGSSLHIDLQPKDKEAEKGTEKETGRQDGNKRLMWEAFEETMEEESIPAISAGARKILDSL